MRKPIYLDYNATTPLAPEVIAAMKQFVEDEFGNPSSSHLFGIEPKRAVAKARRQVASLLGCRENEVIFTSGGTESNNYAIFGVTGFRDLLGKKIITSAIEHPAILEPLKYLETMGGSVAYVPVDEYGYVSASGVESEIDDKTVLITIMHSNNEVGSIQPVKEISGVARSHNIVFHTDASQSLGKIPCAVNELGVDILTVAGHKLYAPKGVGALYVREGIALNKVLHGAGQEMGMRPGTENVTGIVGLGKACEIAERDLTQNMINMKMLRDRLRTGLRDQLEDIRFNGHSDQCLPNTLSVSFRGIEANRILEEIGLDIAASAGAACHSDHIKVSHVLEAMKTPIEYAKGTIRFSLGRNTNADEIDQVIRIVSKAIKLLKSLKQETGNRDH